MKKVLTFLLAVLGLNTACSQNFENMEVKEFAELIADSNVVILDVRNADEFAAGGVPSKNPGKGVYIHKGKKIIRK